MAARKLDTEEIRAAASGRWIEILQQVAGIPLEFLDGSKEHPCPKCQGSTRFRLVDESMGAVLCSHCFSSRNGDGFSAVKWMKGCTFPAAKKLVAVYLGLASGAAGKAKVDPAKDLVWKQWNTTQALIYLSKKPGCTEAAMLANGARMAMYKGQYLCLCWPIIGPDLDVDQPVGWVMANYTGGMLPVWNKEGQVTGRKKFKLSYGSEPGLVGVHGIQRIKTLGLVDQCWKVEGISDLDAMWAAIPEALRERHVVVTTANGAGETPRWQASVLAGVNTNVLHDADQPGQRKVDEWLKLMAITGDGTKICRNVQLPYEIAETHGKDVRDFINEPRTYDDLLAMADLVAPVTIARTETGEVDYAQVEYPANDQILKKLQLEVLYEEEGGGVRVFSTLLRKSSTIKRVAMMKHDDLVQYCGPPAVEHVVVAANDAGDDAWTTSDVRRAIGMAAAGRRARANEKGIGVWRGIDAGGAQDDSLVLVNNNEGAVWTADGQFKRVTNPRVEGLLMDLGSAHDSWYDFPALAKYLELAADVGWRRAVVDELEAMFGMWLWRTKESPAIVTAAVLASWTQTVFRYRPLISISGVSNSGKSALFDAIGGNNDAKGLFGALGFRQEESTCAGVLQGLAHNARIAMCDEFEDSADRKKLIDAFRRATGGGTRALGSSAQKHVEQRLRVLAWVAATEPGLEKEQDLNRFIQLDLLREKAKDHVHLVLPDEPYLLDLGQRSLAVAIRGATAARKLATRLKDTRVPGIDARTVEGYGVLAAVLAVATGEEDDDIIRDGLRKLLNNVERAEQGRTDQDELLNEILTAPIYLGPGVGTMSVAQALIKNVTYDLQIQAVGIKLLEDNAIFLYPPLVKKHLLKDSHRSRQRIDKILLRIPGTERHPLRICGRSLRGLVVPSDAVDLFEKTEFEKTEFEKNDRQIAQTNFEIP